MSCSHRLDILPLPGLPYTLKPKTRFLRLSWRMKCQKHLRFCLYNEYTTVWIFLPSALQIVYASYQLLKQEMQEIPNLRNALETFLLSLLCSRSFYNALFIGINIFIYHLSPLFCFCIVINCSPSHTLYFQL